LSTQLSVPAHRGWSSGPETIQFWQRATFDEGGAAQQAKQRYPDCGGAVGLIKVIVLVLCTSGVCQHLDN